MLGVFRNCFTTRRRGIASLAETIDEHVGMVDAAAVYGYSFGHIAHQYTLPVGALATVNPQAATVTVRSSSHVAMTDHEGPLLAQYRPTVQCVQY